MDDQHEQGNVKLTLEKDSSVIPQEATTNVVSTNADEGSDQGATFLTASYATISPVTHHVPPASATHFIKNRVQIPGFAGGKDWKHSVGIYELLMSGAPELFTLYEYFKVDDIKFVVHSLSNWLTSRGGFTLFEVRDGERAIDPENNVRQAGYHTQRFDRNRTITANPPTNWFYTKAVTSGDSDRDSTRWHQPGVLHFMARPAKFDALANRRGTVAITLLAYVSFSVPSVLTPNHLLRVFEIPNFELDLTSVDHAPQLVKYGPSGKAHLAVGFTTRTDTTQAITMTALGGAFKFGLTLVKADGSQYSYSNGAPTFAIYTEGANRIFRFELPDFRPYLEPNGDLPKLAAIDFPLTKEFYFA
ncbi:protein 2 [Halhan virus 2]|uniref:protein 2 n=1 Tax=Halhan virus 2 TaxID=2480177 RepID=UPI000F0C798A|nr:protein 2 [Halhan virus 2]AYN75551.1 protein 2 [Halhan virus 2]